MKAKYSIVVMGFLFVMLLAVAETAQARLFIPPEERAAAKKAAKQQLTPDEQAALEKAQKEAQKATKSAKKKFY